MKKALVLCGGLPQLELIQQLKKRGITALLADMNPNAPAVPYADAFFPVSTLDVEGIKKVVIDEKVDMLLTVCADQMPLVTSQISEELGLPTYVSYKTAKEVSSKELMKELFVKGGVPTSKHIVRAILTQHDIEELEFPLIVKPVDSYSSHGVNKCTNWEEVEVAFKEAVEISRTNTAIVEEYVGGEEFTVDVYVEERVAKVLSIGVLDKIPGNNKFVICRGRYPSDISDTTRKEIAAVSQKIADVFNLKNTPMLIQLKVDDERVAVIEFCARTGGGIKFKLIKALTGFDVVGAILDLTLGNKPHVEDFNDCRRVVNEFIYCKQGIFDHLEGFEELKAEGVIDDYAQFRLKGQTIGEDVKSSGDRIAYFSIYANNKEELKVRYAIAVSRVKALDVDGNDLIRREYMVLPR